MMKIDARKLYLASKLFLVSGACLVAVGIVLAGGKATPILALGFLGVSVVAAGFFLRRKAMTLRRRFDWRDGHVPA